MGRSAANRQGNISEFHIVWRVVTLSLIHLLSATACVSFNCDFPLPGLHQLPPCLLHLPASLCLTSSTSQSINTCFLYRSLGCTVVEMLSGKPPWYGFEGPAIVYLIGTSDKPKYKLPDDVSSVSRTFLKRCFIRDPRHRPSADELLSDPFVCNKQFAV